MRFVLAALSVICLIIAFTTSSPAILGLAILGLIGFTFMAIFAFAQARIDANQQRQTYVPSAEEREVMRRAAEKRKQTAAPRRDELDQ